MKNLNKICFITCVVCIVIGTLLSLSVIWFEVHDELVVKSWLTIIVFFLASITTMVVNQVFNYRGKSDKVKQI
jgi:hypothetical protein